VWKTARSRICPLTNYKHEELILIQGSVNNALLLIIHSGLSCLIGQNSLIIVGCAKKIKTTTMPKLKTNRSAAKRFRTTGSGKIRRRKAFKNHILQPKNTKRKRRLSKLTTVDERDEDNVRQMLPYMK
jgi:large subunit ribosomal protein L35